MKELDINELSKRNNIIINNEKMIEIDPTKFLPKKEKEEDNSPKMVDIIGKKLSNAIERKKYEFAMKRKAIKEAIAEKKLNDEINRELTEDEIIEKEMMEENISSDNITTNDNQCNKPVVYKIASNKYY